MRQSPDLFLYMCSFVCSKVIVWRYTYENGRGPDVQLRLAGHRRVYLGDRSIPRDRAVPGCRRSPQVLQKRVLPRQQDAELDARGAVPSDDLSIRHHDSGSSRRDLLLRNGLRDFQHQQGSGGADSRFLLRAPFVPAQTDQHIWGMFAIFQVHPTKKL